MTLTGALLQFLFTSAYRGLLPPKAVVKQSPVIYRLGFTDGDGST